ncbi:MAG: hypothetical protein QM647_12750 [Asticcacaulis sp.]|uniref:hypothetical protein n=1 Tax=Asticcacaulis sp. TaxID=1872648 RepID=UPI0039E2E7D3
MIFAFVFMVFVPCPFSLSCLDGYFLTLQTKNAASGRDAAFLRGLARRAAGFTSAVWVWLGFEVVPESWRESGGVNMVWYVAFSLVIENTIQTFGLTVNFKN